MKKFLIISLLTCTFTAQAQYLPNKGFENWKTSCGSSYQASTTIGGESAKPDGGCGEGASAVPPPKEHPAVMGRTVIRIMEFIV